MNRLFLLLLTLWAIPVAFAQSWLPWPLSCMDKSKEVEKSLILASFKCSVKTVDNCSYKECTGSLPSYPKPVLVIIPAMAESLRLHFHGHKLGKFPEYEKDLSSMVKSFGIAGELCKSSEVTVFPESDGSCSTFDTKLKTKDNFDLFLKELHSATGQNLKQDPLNISAHSGGGRTVSRFLDAGFSVNQVTIFDGTYSEPQKNSLKNWYQKNEGKLILATVKGMDPDAFANKLKTELGVKMTPSQSTIKGTTFDVSTSGRLIHFSRSAGPVGSLQAHYDVLTQTWPASN
jgi:hypothetical protein